MKFTLFSTAVLLATLAHAQNNPDPQINTPVSVTQCQITSLTFSGTHPPFVISAIPGGQPGGVPLEEIVTTSVSPYAWLVNLRQGTYLTLQIRDSVGSLQYSSPITVLNGSNDSCVGQGGSITVTNSATTPLNTGTNTAGGGTTSPSGTSSPGGTTTSKPSSNTATSTRSSATTTSSNAASHIQAQMGVAGVLGLVGAALMM